MITYRASLDVPEQTVLCVSRWLAAHRKAHDARPWQRASTPFARAVLVPRWFKDATDIAILARDARVSIATAYRYPHEAIDVIAQLADVLAQSSREGWDFVCLDGTLIPTVRCATKSAAGHDLWYSGKHHRHGGNVHVLTGPDGYPEWVSDAEAGSTHDITAARAHALPALYPAAAAGLKTLADRGYAGAGIGILVPVKGNNLAPGDRARNTMISALRAPAERANARTRCSNEPGKPSNASPRPGQNKRDHRRSARTPSPTKTEPVRKPPWSRSSGTSLDFDRGWA